MPYDFKLLPISHRKQNAQLTGLLFSMMVLLLASLGIHLHQVTSALAWILLGMIGVVTSCLILQAYRDKRSINRFIATSASDICTEAELWSLVPPSFSWLSNNPEVLDAAVTDGYAYQLDSGIPFILFSFSYVKGKDGGKKTRTYQFTIAAVREQQVYPHLFLDGKQNGTSYSYETSQRLSLEGDFDNYFNLYVPDSSATEALEILTPDVMQVLVDGGRPYDVELIDDMFLLIARDSQYQCDKLTMLFRFINLFDQELRSKPVDWNNADLHAMQSAVLQPRRLSDPTILLWLILGVAALGLLCFRL